MNNYSQYYQNLIKPDFAPPEWVFGFAWGIIYPLMAVAFVYIALLVQKGKLPKKALWIYIVNIFFNLLFTPIQFGLQNNLLSAIDILIVVGTLFYLQVILFKKSKLSFILLLPYLLWGTFATILQITITYLNF